MRSIKPSELKKMDTNEQLAVNETKKNEGCFKKLKKLFEKSTKETGYFILIFNYQM